MPDMLVKLYDRDFNDPIFDELKKDGIIIKRAIAPEKNEIAQWALKHFDEKWQSECECALASLPSKCYVAIKDKKIIGFACFDTTCKAFFGPTGVDEKFRGKGVGKALLLKALEGLKELGYAYGIIGAAGPVHFYEKCCGAIAIEDSWPGIFKDMINL